MIGVDHGPITCGRMCYNNMEFYSDNEHITCFHTQIEDSRVINDIGKSNNDDCQVVHADEDNDCKMVGDTCDFIKP